MPLPPTRPAIIEGWPGNSGSLDPPDPQRFPGSIFHEEGTERFGGKNSAKRGLPTRAQRRALRRRGRSPQAGR